MRFRESRPYAKTLFSKLKDLYEQDKVNPSIAYQLTASLIAQALKKEGISDKYINDNNEAMTLFTLESMEAIIWAQWSLAESQLYCFNENLIESFKNSSALDLTIKNLKFPFEHSYFHFGTQVDMPLHNGILFVEGAYVFFNEISLRITLCGTWKEELDNAPLRAWYARGKECYDLRIPSYNYDLPLEQAINNALQSDIEDLHKSEALLLEHKIPFIDEKSSQSFIQAHQQNQESYKKALSLIANALCYLTAYNHDIKTMWQPGSPIKLVNQTNSTKPKEKTRAISKLKSLGFAIIYQVGDEFGKHFDNNNDNFGLSNRRVHWRRGHWRMQPYGVNHSLRKLIWITPTRIGVSSSEDVSRLRMIE